MSSVLAGISDPAVVDVGAAMDRGRTRRADRKMRRVNEMAGKILSETLGGKLGSLAELDPTKAIQVAQALDIPVGETARIQSMMGDIQIAANLYEAGLPMEAAQVGSEKAAFLEGLGIEPHQYYETIAGLTSEDPETVQLTGESLVRLRDTFIAQGMLEAPPHVALEAANAKEFRKEVRAQIDKSVTEISDEANGLQGNYDTIASLGEEITKGNRQATAQALIALVKLGDPTSTVREGEMVAGLNNQSPAAALMQYFAADGTEISEDMQRAVIASLDPLAPGVVNVANLMNTANAIISSKVPPLQTRYAEQQEKADNAELSKRAKRTLFGKGLTNRIAKLSDISSGPVSTLPAGLPEGSTDNGDGTYTLPDGKTKVRPKQ